MKRSLRFLLVALSLVVFLPTTASAAVPDFVTYSGRLTDGTGWGQSDFVALTFRIYDCGCELAEQCDKPCDEWPGTPLKEQAFAGTAIQDGYFSVILTGVADVFAAHDQTWLTVCVGAGCTPGDDLLPRQAVGSVPYAISARTSTRTTTNVGPFLIAANSVYRGNTLNAPGVVGKGSFSETGTTNGHIRFPAPDGVTEVEGYRAAKLACEAALGSPTAHFCTSQHMLMSVQVGIVPDDTTAWTAMGIENIYTNSMGKAITNDCVRWRNSEDSDDYYSYMGGAVWKSDHYFAHTSCGNTLPIACCDFAIDQ